MKKLIIIPLIAALFFSCKQDISDRETTDEPFKITQYAKYAVIIHKDPELKNRLTLLAKAEEVKKDIDKTFKDDQGREVAFVVLTDGQEGYLQSRHLADKPVIFVADTRAHRRNNIASNITGTIPVGTIGFIIDERADWVQVYVGEISGTWITDSWVRDGYQISEELLINAKIYEEANALLSKEDSSSSDIDEAKEKFRELLESDTLFADLASEMLKKLSPEEYPDRTDADMNGQAKTKTPDRIKTDTEGINHIYE